MLVSNLFALSDYYEYFDMDLDYPERYFTEHASRDIDIMITEAATGVTKQNIFMKLWNLLKKAFAWIVKQLSKFVNWIKGMFSKKQKSADQCVMEVLGNNINQTNKLVTESADPNTQIKIKKRRIIIPSSPASSVKMEDSVELIEKEVSFIMSKNADEIQFTFNDFRDEDPPTKNTIVNHRNTDRDYVFYLIPIFFNNPKVMDNLQNTITAITTLVDTLKDSSFAPLEVATAQNTFDKFYKSYEDARTEFIDVVFGRNSLDVMSLKANDIDNMIKRMNDLNASVSLLADPNTFEILSKNQRCVEIANNIAGIILQLQMAINHLGYYMSKVYIIDAKFEGKVSDVNILAKVVKKFISSGMHPKYVSYNLYILADSNLRGNVGNKDHPIWGQSRVVFFPKNKNCVHKIAINSTGVRANLIEDRITKIFTQEHPAGKDFIPLVQHAYEGDYIIDMDRVTPGPNILKTTYDKLTAEEMLNKVREFQTNNGIKFNITSDTYAPLGHNIGVRDDGKYVIMDYGSMSGSN